MKANEIKKFSDIITYNSIQIILDSGEIIYGFFEFQENSSILEKENKWCFVKNNNSSKYHLTKGKELIDILDGFKFKTIKKLPLFQ